MARINLDLGAGEVGRRRRELLDKLVAAIAPHGRRGEPSMSEAMARMVDAFGYDPARTTALFGDIMEVAEESYALEGMTRQVAETNPPPAPTLGKYRTERGAKTAADLTTDPFVVQYDDGSYDWFAQGAAVGVVLVDGTFMPFDRNRYHIVARRVAGRGWKATSR